jgi:hypothetical protein
MQNVKMDANFKITSQINKLAYLDLSMSDHIRANFEKEISNPLVKLVYEAILNTKEQIDHQTKVKAPTYDDTQDINPADFVPTFPQDFNYGVNLGWTVPWTYDIVKIIFGNLWF